MPLLRSLIVGEWRFYRRGAPAELRGDHGKKWHLQQDHHFHRGLRPQVGGYRDKEGRIKIKIKK